MRISNFVLFAIYIVAGYLIFPGNVNAAVNDRIVASWNLQGSSASTESKWNTNIRQIVVGQSTSSSATSGPVDVVAIQEAGSPPSSASLEPPLGARLDNPDSIQVPVEEYRWNLGSVTRPNQFYIYFARVDTGANRVNLALVTRNRADGVVFLRPRIGYQGARPVLGVRFGSDYYFTTHALANGGSDAPETIDRVWRYFQSRNDTRSQWMVMGDFNRSPASLEEALYNRYTMSSYVDTLLIHQNRATQISGGNLDYAVIGQYDPRGGGAAHLGATVASASLFLVAFLGHISSDHTPILFTPQH